MPRTATATSPGHDDEATMTHVDELIQRGRSQGHLSLPELRAAFERAKISPTEARSIVRELTEADRKSTRLNSSHQIISYAVFCLKKKNKQTVYGTRSHVDVHNTRPT